MSKKIIALSLALMLIVTCFVACGKKYETTKVNGKDVILVTDKNGEPATNKDEEVIALVTDKNGEVLTYANGEDQTYYIEVEKEYVVGEGYSFNPKGDWIYQAPINGFVKDGSEGNIYVNVVESEFKYTSLDEYIEKSIEDNEEFFDLLMKTYPQTEYSIVDGQVTERNLNCKIVETKIKDDKGMNYYGYVVYFVLNGNLISINYTSQNYTYEETDVLKLINESFSFEKNEAE